MLEVFQTAIRNLLFFALRLEGGSYPRQLTKKEEQECLKRVSEGDEGARNRLIEHNLRLVAYIVNKHYGDSKEQEDLVSIGTIGLIKAAETFNPEKAISFSTYASTCIQNQIKMYFRKTKRQSSEVYMNEPIDTDKNGNEITIADIFKDDVCVDEEVDLKMNMEKLYRYVNSVLDDRERVIISRRYGLMATDGTVSLPLAQREVAKILGISRSYVSRIEKRALEKLRAAFEEGEKSV